MPVYGCIKGKGTACTKSGIPWLGKVQKIIGRVLKIIISCLCMFSMLSSLSIIRKVLKIIINELFHNVRVNKIK